MSQLNPGNPEIKAVLSTDRAIDTGKKYVHSDGVISPIFRKTLTIGALPNATLKNVAHGETIALAKYARVADFRADNGTNIMVAPSLTTTFMITATNVVVTTATDLSLYLRGIVTIEFCKS